MISSGILRYSKSRLGRICSGILGFVSDSSSSQIKSSLYVQFVMQIQWIRPAPDANVMLLQTILFLLCLIDYFNGNSTSDRAA